MRYEDSEPISLRPLAGPEFQLQCDPLLRPHIPVFQFLGQAKVKVLERRSPSASGVVRGGVYLDVNRSGARVISTDWAKGTHEAQSVVDYGLGDEG